MYVAYIHVAHYYQMPGCMLCSFRFVSSKDMRKVSRTAAPMMCINIIMDDVSHVQNCFLFEFIINAIYPTLHLWYGHYQQLYRICFVIQYSNNTVIFATTCSYITNNSHIVDISVVRPHHTTTIYLSDATFATKYRSITSNSHIVHRILSRRSGVMINYYSDAAFIITRRNITITRRNIIFLPTDIAVLESTITVIICTQPRVVLLPVIVAVSTLSSQIQQHCNQLLQMFMTTYCNININSRIVNSVCLRYSSIITNCHGGALFVTICCTIAIIS